LFFLVALAGNVKGPVREGGFMEFPTAARSVAPIKGCLGKQRVACSMMYHGSSQLNGQKFIILFEAGMGLRRKLWVGGV
jgi:hypothetical protein